jgi:hypothetical protein
MQSHRSMRAQPAGGQAPMRAFTRYLPGLCLILCSLFLLTPVRPVVHADGGAPNLAYVAGGGQGVSIIDIAQQRVTSTVSLGGDPSMVYLSIDGRYLYLAQPALNRVTMLVARTEAKVCSASVPGQPSLLTFDPGTNRLYVAGNGASTITALDGSNCTIKQTIQTTSPVYGMNIAQVGSGTNGGNENQIWFSTTNSLNVFQLPDKIQSIAIPASPQYVSIPPGATVYVTTRQGTVLAVSLQTQQVTPPLLTGGDFGPMDYDAFTSEIYVPDKKRNQIDVLTPIFYGSNIPKEPNHVITLGVQPRSVAITSDGNLAFIALTGGNVAMYDILGKQLINTIFVGGDPRFIITGLYPPTNAQTITANGSPIPTVLLTLIAAVALLVLLAIATLIILGRRKKDRE